MDNGEHRHGAAEALIAAALRARDRAHAPYSGFRVGAALRTRSGAEYIGCNVENASFGLTICAERVAISSAIAGGDREPVSLAVVAPGGAAMCGACRQFLREFGADIEVLLGDVDGSYRVTTLDELLPGAFGPTGLTDRRDAAARAERGPAAEE